MHFEQTAPADSHGDLDDELYLSPESAQWERDDAIVLAEMLRRRQARIDERRQFGNPIAMHDLQRVMVAWTRLSVEARAS